jgi:hypothetical protein
MEGVHKQLSTKSFTKDDLLVGVNREVVPVLAETRAALNVIAPNVSAVLEGSKTYNPINIPDGFGSTTTVDVAGAVLGDFAIASFSLDLQGITLTAWVSAADVVSVRLQNESALAVNLASGTLRVRVFAQ